MDNIAVRLTVAAVAAFAGMLLLPSTALACSCVTADAASHARHADLVVLGTVQARDGAPWWQQQFSSGDPVSYRIDVERVYKGHVGEVAEVRSVSSSASCGIDVSVGNDYVLYADRTDSGDLRADLCGGTTTADRAALAAAERTLGPPAPPDPSVLPPSQRSSVVFPVAGAALVVAALAAIAVALRQGATLRPTAAGGAGRARSR